jgi:3-oxoacyl-[acyl-carrier protein] reductase
MEMCCPKTGLTANIPFGRLGRPEEVAEAASSVVSNPYVTDQTISVNGGLYFR